MDFHKGILSFLLPLFGYLGNLPVDGTILSLPFIFFFAFMVNEHQESKLTHPFKQHYTQTLLHS